MTQNPSPRRHAVTLQNGSVVVSDPGAYHTVTAALVAANAMFGANNVVKVTVVIEEAQP